MGTYLNCGIATDIMINKNGHSEKEILNELKKHIDLNIYNVYSDEEGILLKIKKNIFEKNIVSLLKEKLSDIVPEEKLEFLKEIDGKNYDEINEIAKGHKYHYFQALDGYLRFCNRVEYAFPELRNVDISVDLITFMSDGKIVMECWAEIFRYIRSEMIKSTNNPLRTALFVTIN